MGPESTPPSGNGTLATATPADGRLRASFSKGSISARIFPLRGEGYIDMAVRISNQPKHWSKLRKWNKNRRILQTDRPISVPFSYLNAAYRVKVVESLFPDDQSVTAGWQHQVTFRGETMWMIAEVFTGDGANYPKIQKANSKAKGETISVGDKILIPADILSEEFGIELPSHPELSFSRDDNGKVFAEYALKSGEALYSAVVVRFTGRIEPNDVNAMATKIMRANGIKDARKIPTGKKLRIPFEDLSEDFATSGAPDRVRKVQRNKRGSSIHVILDPGHGGSDPGAIRSGLYEDELAYDLAMRTREALERQGVNVYLTIKDPEHNGRPSNARKLPNTRREQIKTTPAYTIRDARASVNLRVYLINDIYRKLRAKGVDAKNIYMLSIHLDSLHPSMHGSMIYYPNAGERSKRFKARGRLYGKFAESRNANLKFSKRENREAESFSYDFSRELIRNLRRTKVPVHSYRPIRPFVYRKNRKWTPAIIKYSQVPTSILLEAINMANRSDFRNIQDHRFRQRIADAIVKTIL